jgi:hypothetical protein
LTPTGETYDQDWFIDALTRLQSRYPTFIRKLSLGDLSVDIGFYIEDIAMDCAQSLLDNGITVVHRLDQARTISIQLPSLLVQNKILQAHTTLEEFFMNKSQHFAGDSRKPYE